MKKKYSIGRIILAALAVVLLASVFLTGCTSNSNSSLVPEELQTFLKSCSKKTYEGADYAKADIQTILGICSRTLTQEQMEQTIADFEKAKEAKNDNGVDDLVALLYQIKDQNLYLSSLSERLDKISEATDKEALLQFSYPSELTDMITKIDTLGLYSAIDSMAAKGYLTVDCETLKTGIAQDFVTSLAIGYLQDQDKASEDAKTLYDSLTGQWVAYEAEETLNEEVKEVSANDLKEETVSAEDQAAYAPEGGAVGDLMTDAQKAEAQANGSYSNVTVNNSTAAEDSASNGMNYNQYLKDLLNSSGKQRASLLKKSAQDVPTDFKGSYLDESTGKLVIIRKEIQNENNEFKISNLFDNTANIYPGAILYANQNLADGTPTEVIELKRNSYQIGNTLNSKTATVSGSQVGKTNVDSIVQNMVSGFSGKQQAAMTYKWVDVSSEKQLDAALGVSGSAKKWGIDVESCSSGKKQTTLITMQQIYYSVNTDSANANTLLDPSTTQDDLKNVFYDSNEKDRLNGVYVNQVNYGRMIVIKLETSSQSGSVKAAWNSAFFGGKQSLSAKEKELLQNTTYSVAVYGGSGQSAGELIQVSDMSKVKEILAKDCTYDGTFKAWPISYSTTWLDTGDHAVVNSVANYVKTTVEEHPDVSVEINGPCGYGINYQELMGRKITAIDSKTGKITLGPWTKLWSATCRGNKYFTVKGNYAEFGYSFDIFWGTDWPYSDVFWRIDKGVANKIYIDLGGECRTASIRIKVNDNQVYYNSNCDSHKQKDWKNLDK